MNKGVGGLMTSETMSPQGGIKPEETWADKGRYPLIKLEIRGDVVYEWSLLILFFTIKLITSLEANVYSIQT